jgi:hypothetical protein
MTAPSLSVARRRARLARYALWQAADFGINVAIIETLIFGLLGVTFIMNMHAQEAFLSGSGMTMSLGQKLNVFKELFTMFSSVAPMIAMTGIVSTDRTSGYTRFLFAKPLSPVRYYLQAAVVRWLGVLVVAHVLMLGWSFYAPLPAYSWRAIAALTCLFVAIGGMVFLLSVVSRYDGLIAIVLLLVSAIAWDKWEHAGGFKQALTYLLPPISKLGEIPNWFVGVNGQGSVVTMPFPTTWFWWLSGYGMACLVSGLVMLRRVPLTKA